MARTPGRRTIRCGLAILGLLTVFALIAPAVGAVPVSRPSDARSGDRVAAPAEYSVIFTEYYWPNGTFWTVTIQGMTWNSTGISLVAVEPSGTYDYTAEVPGGAAYPILNGSFTVAGGSVNVTLSPTGGEGAGGSAPSAAGGTSTALTGWAGAVAIAVVGVLGVAVLALLAAGRRSSAASGPTREPQVETGSTSTPSPKGTAPGSGDSDPMGHML